MVNTSSKGGRIERKCAFFFREHGYTVERSRMSKGVFDLVLTRKTEALFRARKIDLTPPTLVGESKLKSSHWRGIVISTSQNRGVESSNQGVSEARYVQIKANQWRMDYNSLTKMSTIPLPEGAVREFIRHDDHPSMAGLCTVSTGIVCLRARRVLPDGSWKTIALLPEWEEEQPLEIAVE